MKRLTALLLVLIMALALGACGFERLPEAESPFPEEDHTAEKTPQSAPAQPEETQAEETQPGELRKDAMTIKPQVVLENELVRITATRVSSDETGLTAYLQVENLSDKELLIAREMVVNGMIHLPMYDATNILPNSSSEFVDEMRAGEMVDLGIERISTLQLYFTIWNGKEKLLCLADVELDGADPSWNGNLATMLGDSRKAEQLGRKVLLLQENLDFTVGVFHVDYAAAYLNEEGILCVDFNVENTGTEAADLMLRGPFADGMANNNIQDKDLYGTIYPGVSTIVHTEYWPEAAPQLLQMLDFTTVEFQISDENIDGEMGDFQLLRLENGRENTESWKDYREFYRDELVSLTTPGLVTIQEAEGYGVYLPIVISKLQDGDMTGFIDHFSLDGEEMETYAYGVRMPGDYAGVIFQPVGKFSREEEAKQLQENAQQVDMYMQVGFGDEVSHPLLSISLK